MNIEAKEFQIKMTQGDLWSTAFDVQQALENSLKTHWINHQDRWKENEKDRLSRLRQMFYALGRPELHEQIYTKADEIFKEFNDKRNEALKNTGTI